jgi:hypothetical protein
MILKFLFQIEFVYLHATGVNIVIVEPKMMIAKTGRYAEIE